MPDEINIIVVKLQAKLKSAKEEKEKELTKLAAQWDKKEKTRTAESKAKVDALNKKVGLHQTDLCVMV